MHSIGGLRWKITSRDVKFQDVLDEFLLHEHMTSIHTSLFLEGHQPLYGIRFQLSDPGWETLAGIYYDDSVGKLSALRESKN